MVFDGRYSKKTGRQRLKKLKRNIILIVLIVIASLKAKSQEHRNSWFRTTISIPVATKFKADFEEQLRRQNGFENENPFDKSLLYSFRTWCYYKYSEDISLAVSPFAYFSNYPIIQKQTDATTDPANEYRFSAAIEVQHKMASRLFLVNRTAFEYRIFEGTVENVIRLRYRTGYRYDLNPKFNIGINDEIFINAYGTDDNHLFDQNRVLANLTFKPNDAIKFDLGYIHISRLPKSNIDLIEENNFYLNLTYTLLKKRNHSL